MSDDSLRTDEPVPLVTANIWKIPRLELAFPHGGEPIARFVVAAGKEETSGSIEWLQEKEIVVTGAELAVALGAPPQGTSVYESARIALYRYCQQAGHIPASARMREGT